LKKEELNADQVEFRKLLRRHGAVARFFRVIPTGDVIYTIDPEGKPYIPRLAQVLNDYWGRVLADRTPVGSVQ